MERKRKKFSGKCSQTTQKRQQLPENYMAFVVKNSKNDNKRRIFSVKVPEALHHCFANEDSEALRQCFCEKWFCSFVVLLC
ncbi:hypothetical protein [Gardnerella sp. KA01001]|uniref:hypothetical protein n=1 Tax=Gardnerella sp. KA01001 TaxID=2749081 RepID=UPI003BACF481